MVTQGAGRLSSKMLSLVMYFWAMLHALRNSSGATVCIEWEMGNCMRVNVAAYRHMRAETRR